MYSLGHFEKFFLKCMTFVMVIFKGAGHLGIANVVVAIHCDSSGVATSAPLSIGRRYASGFPTNIIFLFVGDDSRRINFLIPRESSPKNKKKCIRRESFPMSKK